MPYLRLIKNKIQEFCEIIAATLNIDVTVVDNNLIRIAGTGYFLNKIDENSPKNSIFHQVITTGQPYINIDKETSHICDMCSWSTLCYEKKNMTYPIEVDNKIIGLVSFVCFRDEQLKEWAEKNKEYQTLLKYTVNLIEKEVFNIQKNNKLIISKTEINEIINCIDKGIIIIDDKKRIIHINPNALEILNLNLSKEKIINTKLDKFIDNLTLQTTDNEKIISFWNVRDRKIKVMYKINNIIIENKNITTIISFDKIDGIINIAMNYQVINNITFSSIIGESDIFKKAIEKAKIAAKSNSTILLQAESGTGKELFAKAIHNESYRHCQPFIAVNCAGIPDNLIESELFGYERGAFTGANRQGKIGKFELANNGTIFLDEIGDLNMHLQSKLLRVLQEMEIEKIGGKKPIKTNLRVIAATNKNLEKLISENKFRLDLFYRINVIPIYLPALTERDQDVILCAEYILNNICKKMKKKRKYLSNDINKIFLAYEWPGNIRELQNVLEYAVTFSKYDYIQKEDLPKYLFKNQIYKNIRHDLNLENNIKYIINEIEKDKILEYLNLYGDSTASKKLIAKKLNISLTTLYRRLNNYN